MFDQNDPVAQAIVQARVHLMLNKPFFGHMITRMNVKDASTWCKTAATDGRNFFYNREFIKALSPEQLVFLLGHELFHAILDHLGRLGTRDHKLANMAKDYVINYILVEEKLGQPLDNYLYDKRFTSEMSWEEVYEVLKKSSAKVQMTLDEHLDLLGEGTNGDDEEGDGTTEVTLINPNMDGPPQYTQDDLDAIRNELRASMINAAQSCGGAGNLPGAIRRLLDDLTEPKMDWKQLLEQHLQSCLQDDYTFQKFSKKSWGTSVILPGTKDSQTIDIAVSIDTSGSMTDDMLKNFLGEVKGIMETFETFKLMLWTFDTQVYGYKEFTRDNLEEIMEYDPKGGGGTFFGCNWEFMIENEIEPKRFVMFTDGFDGGDQGERYSDYCDTLFIVHGQNAPEMCHGITVKYDD